MEEKFIELVKEALEINDREIFLADKFREYAEWNSLASLSLVSLLEEEYGIMLSSEDFKKLHTLDDLMKEIKSRI